MVRPTGRVRADSPVGVARAGGYDEPMSITFLLSALALVAVLALFAAIFVGGFVYVLRMKRQGTEATLAGARRRRELRQN